MQSGYLYNLVYNIYGSKKKPYTGLYTSHNATATTQTEVIGCHPEFDS